MVKIANSLVLLVSSLSVAHGLITTLPVGELSTHLDIPRLGVSGTKCCLVQSRTDTGLQALDLRNKVAPPLRRRVTAHLTNLVGTSLASTPAITPFQILARRTSPVALPTPTGVSLRMLYVPEATFAFESGYTHEGMECP
ncbi:hypothetical protein BJ165DRAFT_1401187 [Panaeolus papilionaceus]|nr:hypothetical protein BJ165DRAFT_1401187 [Panaeolus papilionaceus]